MQKGVKKRYMQLYTNSVTLLKVNGALRNLSGKTAKV